MYSAHFLCARSAAFDRPEISRHQSGMTQSEKTTVRLGGAAGYWGEADMAWAQLLGAGGVDYLVFDYLAEITMSILAAMRARDPKAGYVPDFVSGLARHLPEIARQGVKVCANAGGVNPQACGDAVRALIEEAGLNLKVAVITGDDLMGDLHAFENTADMFSGEGLPPRDQIVSANAYLGAFPIAKALDSGADIVITGRCVDSAVTLGALIHEFGWCADQLDHLAQGSLIGHILECGPQATGGNFTDWDNIADGLVDIGYPIADVRADGSALITKSGGTGGIVSVGTVSEQMLYEIGDPAHYALPDVICDFSGVSIDTVGPDCVEIKGARGRGVPSEYKASLTVRDGYRLSALFFMVGEDAVRKANIVYEATLARARAKLTARGMADFTQTALEITGDGTPFGKSNARATDIAFRISVRHEDPKACALVLKESSGFGLATPPGLSLFSGARPKPQPVIRLFSALVDKTLVAIEVNGKPMRAAPAIPLQPVERGTPEPVSTPADTTVLLKDLAWLRSGDKGDKSNIGVIARKPEFMPYIWAALTKARLGEIFAHLAQGKIERWYLPGPHAMNILMDQALGGGGMASLRNDPQGKAFSQILASTPVLIAQSLL